MAQMKKFKLVITQTNIVLLNLLSLENVPTILWKTKLNITFFDVDDGVDTLRVFYCF